MCYIHSSMAQNINIFIVYHKILNEKYMFNEYNENVDTDYIQNTFVYYGVNEIFTKSIINPKYHCKQILEYELSRYDPFLQKRGFMETSAYLHVYHNGLYKDLDFVGFCQYDMTHKDRYENMDPNTIYLLKPPSPIVECGKWHPHMYSGLRNIDYLLQHYNQHFKTEFIMASLEGLPFSLWQTNIYPVRIYEKLCSWLDILVKDVYPWSVEPPYETHWGVIGGYIERAISLFNALEIIQGCAFAELTIEHYEICEKHQYSHRGFLNFFDKDISTRYIENKPLDHDHDHHTLQHVKQIEQMSDSLFKATDKLSSSFKNTLGAPFIKNGELYSVYSYDPLIILKHDSKKGCEVVFCQDHSVSSLFSFQFENEISTTCLKSGSNLVHYRDGLYVGGCYSQTTLGTTVGTTEPNKTFYFTHIVLLDVIQWRIVYLSKPIAYVYPNNDLETLEKASILMQTKTGVNCVQIPISIQTTDNVDTYLVNVNVEDKNTLVYEIKIGSPISLFTDQQEVGFWNNRGNLRDWVADL